MISPTLLFILQFITNQESRLMLFFTINIKCLNWFFFPTFVTRRPCLCLTVLFTVDTFNGVQRRHFWCNVSYLWNQVVKFLTVTVNICALLSRNSKILQQVGWQKDQKRNLQEKNYCTEKQVRTKHTDLWAGDNLKYFTFFTFTFQCQ